MGRKKLGEARRVGVSITLDPDSLRWAELEAAKNRTTLSQFLGRLVLECRTGVQTSPPNAQTAPGQISSDKTLAERAKYSEDDHRYLAMIRGILDTPWSKALQKDGSKVLKEMAKAGGVRHLANERVRMDTSIPEKSEATVQEVGQVSDVQPQDPYAGLDIEP